MITLNKNRLIGIMVVIGVVLSIPFIAMQFTAEVNWSLPDFFVMGALLFATGIGVELTLSSLKSMKSRIMTCGIILFLLFITWAELAVGLFGTPFAGS